MKRITAVFLALMLLLSCAAYASGEASGDASGGASGPDTEMPESIESRITACLYLDGIQGEQDASGCTYTATAMDQSCVYAKNGAVYTLSGAVLDKPEGILSTAFSFVVPTGEVLWNTTEAGSSGVNSVALAWGEGTVLTLRDCGIYSYYLDENGVCATGWQTIRGKQYYFSKKGVAARGAVTIEGKTYYFNSSGVCTNP